MAVLGYLFSLQLPSILLYAEIPPSNVRDVKCVNQAPNSAQPFPLPQFRQSTEKVRTVAARWNVKSRIHSVDCPRWNGINRYSACAESF